MLWVSQAVDCMTGQVNRTGVGKSRVRDRKGEKSVLPVHIHKRKHGPPRVERASFTSVLWFQPGSETYRSLLCCS